MNRPKPGLRPLTSDEPATEVEHHSRQAFDGGDGGGYDGPMDERLQNLEEFARDARQEFRTIDGHLQKLEDFAVEARQEFRGIDTRLSRIEVRLDQTASKDDLAYAINGVIKWMVGLAITLSVAAVTIMTFVLNNATPKATGSAPPAIFYVYPGQAPMPAVPVPK